jgi:O-antigen/teichoic acid export membrane protein
MVQSEVALPAAAANPKDRYFEIDHLRADLGKRAARGGAVTMAANGFKFAVTLVGTSITARLLTPEDYGVIGMVAILTGFLSIFKDMGLAAATIQKPTVTKDQVSTLFWVNIAVCSALAVLTAGFAPALAWFYGDGRLIAITAVTALGFIFNGLTVQHDALLRRQMRFVALSSISIASIVVGYSVAIVLAWRGFSYWSLVYSQLAQFATSTIGVWTVCRWRPGMPKRDSGVRSMIKFGGNFTGFSLVSYFARNFDNLLIGKFWGAQQLGVYARAYQLMGLPIEQINEPITAVAVPALSRLTDSPERYRQAYLRLLEKIAMLTIPGVALMIVTADWIVRIMLGPKWYEVGMVFLVLGITGAFQPVANTTGWLFLTQGRTKELFNYGLIHSPVIVLSFVVGIHWGALGVAIAYAVTKCCITDPFLYWYVGRSGPVRTFDFYRTMAPFTFASLAALVAAFALRYWLHFSNPVAGIIVCTTTMAVVYLGVLALIPKGRAALQDAIKSILVALKRKQND